MCGIVGYVRPKGLLEPMVIAEMTRRVRHRGPDGQRTWTDATHGVALGHTRLKVQDLTEAADQPMVAPDGSIVLIYNGEIYNFGELRGELLAEGVAFHSTGDTAVLFELCRRDPSLGFLRRLNGMFALALWHGPSATLTLVRDRTGVKPLVWGEIDGGIAFASEMAAIRPVMAGTRIDPGAVAELLTLGFIAAPRTVFADVHKLPPGRLLRYRAGRISIEKWATDPPNDTVATDLTGACALIRERVADAVRSRLVADVPVGVFLSGGIDSAIVAATAVRVSSAPVRTFSVGFPGHPFYDETPYAMAVAQRLGTEHTVLPLTLDEVRAAIPAVRSHLGEPFADSSALPMYLLSRLTRRHVTVALSGDGADELFAGYNRYAATTLAQRLGWLAHTPLYGPLRAVIERLPARRETRMGAVASQLKRAIRSLDRRLPRRYANWMRTSDDRTFGRFFADRSRAEQFIESIVELLWRHRGEPREESDLNHHLRTEWRLSLPDDMLTKVDLMSMAHGLEVRSPFLDAALVDAVFPMPADWKLRGWRKKHLLIEAFKDELPAMLHDRPKKGFEVPVGTWLRGPLYEDARRLIESDRCFCDGLLSRAGLLATLEEHGAGRADHNFCLWAIVSLLAWQQEHAPGAVVAGGV